MNWQVSEERRFERNAASFFQVWRTLALAALVASLIPARRAAVVEPMVALRNE